MELGIDFGGTAVKIGLVDDGALVASEAVPIAGTTADLEAAAAAAARLTGDAAPDAVGLAVPGVITANGRGMLRANDKYSFLRGADLVEWAQQIFRAPAVVENDARAALIGEVTSGCADGARDAVAVILGTGIGTAAMMGGTLVRGAHGHAGILGGHVTVDVNAPPCPCGNIGCAESLASTRALREQLPELSGFDDLVAGAAHSEQLQTILIHCLRVWGATVVGMCHAYDPDVVVLSGGILRAGEAVRGPVADYVATHLWSSSHRPRIVVPTSPEFSVVRGLAALAGAARGPASMPTSHTGSQGSRGKETT